MTDADDRAAIAEVLSRYALHCDRREFDAAGELFTAGAQAEYSGVRLAPGQAAIVAHIQPLARLAVTQHIVGTVSVRVTGDEATADSYTLAHLVRPVDGGYEVVHRGLHYADTLVRTPEGWRIAERVHRVLWSTSAPTVWPVPGFTAASPSDH